MLVDKTVVYDIIEQMGDFDAHIAHFTTQIDLSWLREPYPMPVRRTTPGLRRPRPAGRRHPHAQRALRAPSPAIGSRAPSPGSLPATASARLILRGVTDLVDGAGSPAYGDLAYFELAAAQIIEKLVQSLPAWLERSYHP